MIQVPEKVLEVCKVLKEEGYEVNLVGGCVRDALLGKEPKDYDITTNASPLQIEEAYKKAGAYILDIEGASQHGVTFISFNHERYEIASYRSDGQYQDKRHCDVRLGVSLKEDLARRDFTINALAYNPFENKLYDYFGGQNDLKNKIIRTVGNPYERFDEDALRILRAYRFAAQLGFSIDKNTQIAAKSFKKDLKFVSMERKSAEITKILTSDNPGVLRDMEKDGILQEILPELSLCFKTEQNNPYHDSNVGEHTIKVIENTPNTEVLRWAALLHDIGKPDAKGKNKKVYDSFYGHAETSFARAVYILEEYKFSNDFIDKVTTLVRNHDRAFPNKKTIRSYIGKYGQEAMEDLLKLKMADALGHSKEKVEELVEIDKNEQLLFDTVIKEERTQYTLKDLQVSGKDILDLGVKQGKRVGEILNYLHDKVLEDPKNNNKEYLLGLARVCIEKPQEDKRNR